MDEIRELLMEALTDHDGIPAGFLADDILRRLEPYLKGPPIPIKKLSEIAGWLK